MMTIEQKPATNPSNPSSPSNPPQSEITRLIRDVPAAEPYPIDALGDDLAACVEAIASHTAVPPAMAAQSILAAVALAVQKHGNLVIDGRVSPASLFCMTVANTGDRKSAVDTVALYPHREWQDDEFVWHNKAMLDYEQAMRAYKAALKKAEQRKTRSEIEAAIKAVGDPPEKPLLPSLLIGNMTSEGLHRQLNEALPYAGVFSDEGGALIGGYAMSSESLLRTLAEFSGLWGISNELRVRAGAGLTSTRGKRLSMHLMAQPDVAAVLFGKRIAHSQGFLPRLLVCWPETLRGTRDYRRGDLTGNRYIQRYNDRIVELLGAPTEYADGRRDCLAPRNIPLAPDAMEKWIAFHDFIEAQNAPGAALDCISGWASKAAEHAARVATVLSLYDDLNCEAISIERMADGIRLAEFYLQEMFRVHARGEHDEAVLIADGLLRFMRTKTVEVNNIFTSEFLLQYGPNQIRDAVVLQTALQVLAATGVVEPIPGRGRKWRLM